MSINNPIYKPYINPRLKKFFKDHKKAINLIFNTLKIYKPNICDSFYYSIKNPPQYPKYKYTLFLLPLQCNGNTGRLNRVIVYNHSGFADKLYLGCIFYIILYGSIWESFIGPIPGKQLTLSASGRLTCP